MEMMVAAFSSVLQDNNFWVGAASSAVVFGFMGIYMLLSYKTMLRDKAQSSYQTVEKLGNQFYYLVEESEHNRLLASDRLLTKLQGVSQQALCEALHAWNGAPSTLALAELKDVLAQLGIAQTRREGTR